MRQLIRYGLVGIVTNAMLYAGYILVTWSGVDYKVAMTLLYVAGATFGFVGNRKWTFDHRGDVTRTAFLYIAAQIAGYLINLALLLILTDYLGYPHQLAQAFGVIVVAGFLFLTFKYIVFFRQGKHEL